MWSPEGARTTSGRWGGSRPAGAAGAAGAAARAVGRRGALALLIFPAVAACGFRPAFGLGGGLYGRVRADDPTDRHGFDFVARIERQLGAPSRPAYALAYRIEIGETGVAGASASSTTRFQFGGRADWRLTDLATGAEVARDSTSGFSGYSAVGTTISEQAARADAIRRLVEQLADQVAAALLATAGRDPGP